MTGAPPPVAPTATPRPRLRWLVVLVVVLALILATGIAGTALFFTRTFPPIAATDDFTDDIAAGDFDAAFDQVCDRLRTADERRSFDEFARRLSRADELSVDLLSVDRDGDAATVDVDATYDDDTVTTTLRLVREDGDWRPCGAETG